MSDWVNVHALVYEPTCELARTVTSRAWARLFSPKCFTNLIQIFMSQSWAKPNSFEFDSFATLVLTKQPHRVFMVLIISWWNFSFNDVMTLQQLPTETWEDEKLKIGNGIDEARIKDQIFWCMLSYLKRLDQIKPLSKGK
jgi:hypothetical protein